MHRRAVLGLPAMLVPVVALPAMGQVAPWPTGRPIRYIAPVNRFDAYRRDTPDRQLFNRDNPRLSHGCIRVQSPIEFATLLMQRPVEAINEGIAASGTTHHGLSTPVPVFATYHTAFADGAGGVEFRPDFYGRDGDACGRMQRRGAAA